MLFSKMVKLTNNDCHYEIASGPKVIKLHVYIIYNCLTSLILKIFSMLFFNMVKLTNSQSYIEILASIIYEYLW
jgi:hypothetical protein